MPKIGWMTKEIEYEFERCEGINCADSFCYFHDKRFSQCCSGESLNGIQLVETCKKYIPEKELKQ